jgi:hypothetical protein
MLRVILEFGDIEIAVFGAQKMSLAAAPHSPDVLDCRECWMRLSPRTRIEKFVGSHRVPPVRPPH